MTFLEKAMSMVSKPTASEVDMVNDFCPHHLKLEPFDNGWCDNYCEACWNREMPDVSDIEDSITPEKIKELKRDEFIKPIVAPVTKILDSGNRREFETGAVRDIQEGKGRCDLLPLGILSTFLYNTLEDPHAHAILQYIHKFQETGDLMKLHEALAFATSVWGNMESTEATTTMLLEVAIHFEEGAKKYGENNWQKGIPVHCYIDSAVRHYLKYLRGDKDEPHDRAFVWNLMCAIWTCKHKPELNDYAKSE
jgi:hypothetical protein